MKSTTTLLPIFLLLLSTFIVSHLPSATAAAVVDTDGDVMRNGGSYYILSFIAGTGGVDLAATGNETCALSIVQATHEDDEGKLVVISSSYRITVINEGSPLHLAFAPVPECAPTPSEWTVVDGLPNNPSALKITGYNKKVNGSFAIEKSSFGGYKLTFCSVSSKSCSDVGARVDENGQRSLALVGSDTNVTPLLLRFKKVAFYSGRIEKA